MKAAIRAIHILTLFSCLLFSPVWIALHKRIKVEWTQEFGLMLSHCVV